MARYTKKDVIGCARRLAEDLDKPFGNCWKRVEGKPKATVGCWDVDYNATYGGAVINEIVNEAGGIHQPFGPMRRKAREFCDTTRFAMDAIKLFKKK